MSLWIVVLLVIGAYYYGKSVGYSAGSKKAQEYTLEIKKKK